MADSASEPAHGAQGVQRMKARSAKSKGYRLEKEVVQEFRRLGFDARRQPGSGVYEDFPHDVFVRVGERKFVVECKARKEGLRTLDRWRGAADMLVVRLDRKEAMVYMPISVLADLLSPAGPVAPRDDEDERPVYPHLRE